MSDKHESTGIARVRPGANNLGALRIPYGGDKPSRVLVTNPATDAAALRIPCGGKRRRDGQPCEALSVPGKRRCKWHGGCSTGPRTAEGKAKVAANLRERRRSRRGDLSA